MLYPIGLSVFIVCLLMGFGHFFPWPDWLRGEVVNRIFCYSYGVSWVMAVSFLTAALSHQEYTPLIETLVLFAAAGLTTIASYGYDHLREVNNRGKRRERTTHNAEQQ